MNCHNLQKFGIKKEENNINSKINFFIELNCGKSVLLDYLTLKKMDL